MNNYHFKIDISKEIRSGKVNSFEAYSKIWQEAIRKSDQFWDLVNSVYSVMKNDSQRNLLELMISKCILHKIKMISSAGLLINGVGGAGKTFVISNLLQIIECLGLNYAILTPTAAARNVYKDINPCIKAHTIHSFMGFNVSEVDEGMRWRYFKSVEQSPSMYLDAMTKTPYKTDG